MKRTSPADSGRIGGGPALLRWAGGWAGGWAVAAVALLLLKWPTLHDPHYWDALGCYVPEARFLAEHAFDWHRYRDIYFLRPPLFTGLLALFIRFLGPSRELLHAVTCVVVAAALPATYAIARRLRVSPLGAMIAVALCLCSPAYFAQAGLVQSDGPVTSLVAVAWALLLSGRVTAYVICASLAVLTKESAYFLCLPAALLLATRAVQRLSESRFSRRVALGVLPAVLPAAVPCLVLFLWLLVHRALMGTLTPGNAGEFVGPSHLLWALRHDLLDGGRLVLVVCAALVVIPACRRPTGSPPHLPVLEIRATAVAVLTMPLAFPGPLPRYMLPALPLLCALAAAGLARLRIPLRPAAAAGALLILIAGWHGRWNRWDIAHLEVSLAYRDLLALHQQAARELAAVHPRAVLADFPFITAATAPPADGYLPAPLPARLSRDDSMAALCQFDFLVEAQSSQVVTALRTLQRQNAVTLWRQLGPPPRAAASALPGLPPLDPERDLTVRLYRIHCPPAAAQTQAAAPTAPAAARAAAKIRLHPGRRPTAHEQAHHRAEGDTAHRAQADHREPQLRR